MLSNRIDGITYLLGKVLRFGFFLLFIVSIFRHTDSLAGYSRDEVLLFFLTFNFIDVMTQVFFRGVYVFKHDIRLGSLDYTLIKPVNALFYSLSRMIDFLDTLFIIPITVFLIVLLVKMGIVFHFASLAAFAGFLTMSFLIIAGFHILSLAMTVWTSESENVIWMYRESMTLGRFPPEILSAKMISFFTYVIPIVVIVSFPTRALLGDIGLREFFIAVSVAAYFFAFSLFVWRQSMMKYASASS